MELDPKRYIPLDMNRAFGHEHPDIKTNKWYLAKIGSGYYFGKFVMKVYGLCFEGYGQFDAPSYNYSNWGQVWEIVE